MNRESIVGGFHSKFRITQLENQTPAFLNYELAGFRINFMLEELREYAEASGFVYDKEQGKFVVNEFGKMDLEKAFDGLIDLQYVLSGTIRLHGFHTHLGHQSHSRFEEGFCRVHNKNMEKQPALKDGSDSKRGSAYDIVKPEGWVPASLTDLLR